MGVDPTVSLVGAFSVITNLRMELFQALVVTGVHVEVDDALDPVSVPVHLVAGAAHVEAHVLAAEVAEAEHRPRGVLAQQKLLLRVPEQGKWLL